jgi:serine/threonine protein kinase
MSDTLFTIHPSRLDWDPKDTKKVSEGGSLLGEGTFGSVYRGKYNYTTVAIKVIKHRGDVQSAGRTAAEAQHAREVRRLRELSFKHIVQCHGISKSPVSSDVLIVTECLEGGSLYQALQEARVVDARLSDLSFLTIASHIAKGLSYIHDSGFIHGDMKPHNVLLTGGIEIDENDDIAEFPPHVEAKIADFGMSKRLQGGQGADLLVSTVDFGNQAFGTYAYMAPEIFSGAMQLDNEELKRVDVYAFGVVLYEMLTGISPWQYEGVTNPMHLYNLVCGEKHRPAWGPRSDVIRPEYKSMIEMCWHQENMRRPQTGTLITQLDAWITDVKKHAKKPRRPAGVRDRPVTTPSLSSGRTGSDEVESEVSDSSDISRRVDSMSLADTNPSQRSAERGSAVKNKVDMFSANPNMPGPKDPPGYWERSAQSRPHTPAVTDEGEYDPGDSVDFPAAAKRQQRAANTSSGPLSGARPLQDFSDMAGVNVTRVVTQVIKEPEVPQLEIFGANPNTGLDLSMWGAVARQNGPQPPSKPNPLAPGMQPGFRPPTVRFHSSPALRFFF